MKLLAIKNDLDKADNAALDKEAVVTVKGHKLVPDATATARIPIGSYSNGEFAAGPAVSSGGPGATSGAEAAKA